MARLSWLTVREPLSQPCTLFALACHDVFETITEVRIAWRAIDWCSAAFDTTDLRPWFRHSSTFQGLEHSSTHHTQPVLPDPSMYFADLAFVRQKPTGNDTWSTRLRDVLYSFEQRHSPVALRVTKSGVLVLAAARNSALFAAFLGTIPAFPCALISHSAAHIVKLPIRA